MVNEMRKIQNVTKSEQMFLTDLRTIILTARKKSYEAVNAIIVICNWLIGRRIVLQEQHGRDRAEYGKQIVRLASQYLTNELGKGFSVTNLQNFRKLYLSFSALIGDEDLTDASVESMFRIGQARLPNLTWSHFERLIRVPNEQARLWYMHEAEAETWSVRTLGRNIDSQYYYRLLQTPEANRQEVIDEMKQLTDGYQRDKMEIMKNPVVAEFLGLPQNPTYSETKLETAIIEHLKDFIMELGRGFAFVARQKHIKTDMGDFFIDLVFYNFKMRCFVLIDLKTSRITHQDVGQMDMYRRMYDAKERGEADNPTIGLLLCAETSEDLAQYSILHDNDNMFAAKYMTYLPKKEELLAEIERQKRIFELQTGKLTDNDSK